MPYNIFHRPTWAEIDLHNLKFNFHSIKSFVGKNVEYMAVVKADAYGHCAVECAKTLQTEGVEWFGVALPEEGLELRKNGIVAPILCLNGFWNGQEDLLSDYKLTPVVYQPDLADKLNKAAKKRKIIANIHIKIDTGMGRIGVRFDEINQFIKDLRKMKNLRVEGIMTHFACADNLEDNQYTKSQIKRFKDSVKVFENNGFHPKYTDLANSPAAIAHKDSRSNLVRIGGILYGLGGDVLPQGIEKPELKPVMSVHTVISHLKVVPKGETLGYGRSFTTNRKSLIATIPIGYQDGFMRSLSNLGKVIVNGSFAPVVGRISMDWTIIDVTDIPSVKVNEQVVIIGKQNGLSITAEELAKECGTISYEVTCGINRRVVRKFT